MKAEARPTREKTINDREEEKRLREDEKEVAWELVREIIGRQLVSADGRYAMIIEQAGLDSNFVVRSPQWQEILGRSYGSNTTPERIIELIGNFGFRISE